MTIIERIAIERHYIVLDERDVLGLLMLIYAKVDSRIDKKLSVCNCGWADRRKWFVHFNCTNKQWRSIIYQLHNENFELVVKDHTESVYLVKKEIFKNKELEEEFVI